MRAKFIASSACYLVKDDKILFIKYSKKWNQVYAPPGGKVEKSETPTECLIREFKEETNLDLINPKLKFIASYQADEEGVIYFYVADDYKGELANEHEEGSLSWVSIKDSFKLKQFPMNEIIFDYLFKEGLFEGKFIFKGSKIQTYAVKEI